MGCPLPGGTPAVSAHPPLPRRSPYRCGCAPPDTQISSAGPHAELLVNWVNLEKERGHQMASDENNCNFDDEDDRHISVSE